MDVKMQKAREFKVERQGGVVLKMTVEVNLTAKVHEMEKDPRLLGR